MEPEYIRDDEGNLLAILLTRSPSPKPGVHFYTDGELSQQVAFISHRKPTAIIPHKHNLVQRTVKVTQETLIVLNGYMTAYIYDNNQKLVAERDVDVSEVLVLVSGGHGFKIPIACEMIEVKQGPYLNPETDKTRF